MISRTTIVRFASHFIILIVFSFGIGLGDTGEDVDLLDVASSGAIYLSTENAFVAPGISGEDEDIFVCTPTFTGGAVSSCTYSSSLFFDGSAWGLDTNDVDALYLP